MNYLFLNIIVFVSGAIVMIFEMVGSRILSPYLGSSIYVWSSLIGVILASLSLGYYYGGLSADSKSKFGFGEIFFFSGIFIFVTYILKDIILWSFRANSGFIELNTILASIILFAPASYFLGMVTPYAVKYSIVNIEKLGKNIGVIYFLSTLGSIFGTFLAGFYLIPALGTTKILFGLVILLILLSTMFSKKFFVSKALLGIFSIFGIFYIDIVNYQYFVNGGYLELDTIYNKIWVYKGKDAKSGKETLELATDPYGTQCSMFLNDDDLVFEYTKYYRLAKYFNPDLKEALAIGGCNYSYPKDFLKTFTGAKLDVVEIDPGMTQISKEYFNFPANPNLNVIHEDGRMFLNKNTKNYDVIFSDAFNSFSSIPYQLTTIETIKKQYESLNNSGIVILNLISSISGENGRFLRAQYHTYREIFDQVYIFPVSNSDEFDTQNIILVAIKGNQKYDFISEDPELNKYLSRLRKKSINNDTPILTDEYAPVEYYKYKSIHP